MNYHCLCFGEAAQFNVKPREVPGRISNPIVWEDLIVILADLAKSNAVILGVVALIIVIIVIVGIAKGRGKGWKWIIGLIIAAIIGYLLISSGVLRIP